MYNTRYASFFNLAYPELELDNPLSRMHCIHYTSSLYGKLRDEMTGRFNQDLPENLQTAFKKATNFKPQIITKQSINSRKIHEVNHINIGHEDEVEINEAHVRNPNYKGKNYDPNYAQNRLKTTNNTITIYPITRTTLHKVMDHLVNKTTATQDMDTTNPTNKRNWLMCRSHYTDQSAKSNCIRSRRY